MSQKEVKRLEILQKVNNKHMRQNKAAEALNLSVRQIQRLLKAYRLQGPEGLISKKRGKPANNRISDATREMAIFYIRNQYHDFGPTLASEKLLERHDIKLSVETVRKLMIEAEIWTTRSKRQKRAYQPRYRRACYGELIQIDGSDHDWFEGRGPRCNLLVYVDDATSKIMTAAFVPEESTFAYFEATKAYIRKHGKPVTFYSDKHGVFRVNAKDPKEGDEVTQFGRALLDLNIDIINAHSSEAKGRVERANRTLQDRLIKEMRLLNISNAEAGNAYLPQFIEEYNKKFAKPPAMDSNIHRALQKHEINALDDIFSWHEDRTLSNNLTIQYDKVKYIIEDTEDNRQLRRKRVTVMDYSDGRIKIVHEGRELNYRKFDKLRRVNPGAIVQNERLGTVLAYIKEQQDLKELEERSKSCPKRYELKLNTA